MVPLSVALTAEALSVAHADWDQVPGTRQRRFTNCRRGETLACFLCSWGLVPGSESDTGLVTSCWGCDADELQWVRMAMGLQEMQVGGTGSG